MIEEWFSCEAAHHVQKMHFKNPWISSNDRFGFLVRKAGGIGMGQEAGPDYLRDVHEGSS